ncbi:hypothetical protein OE88DRAFT_1664671 [Heliocybe sulcata]|uniref:Uncharacterized protein n=1 Tax=Heliocybe sulcata TaxID=5364 RepID=A0A5C3N375_9AGAM|nr:hypothetical protein OE88DRAFT_1664671 [Heliocybe sulcata]
MHAEEMRKGWRRIKSQRFDEYQQAACPPPHCTPGGLADRMHSCPPIDSNFIKKGEWKR